MSERSPYTVLQAILQIAPDLEQHFVSTITSLRYAAPELHHEFWHRIASILNHTAKDHPKAEEIGKIFSGETS